MAKHQAKPLKPRDVQGLKYLDRLLPVLDQLHEMGCQRDKAGNRCVHYDQYCMLVLLYLFNPFFRFFKHVLGCRHLLSAHQKGIVMQVYCAIIACRLISLWTRRKPTLRSYEMVCLYFMGWATLEELLNHIAKLKPAND